MDTISLRRFSVEMFGWRIIKCVACRQELHLFDASSFDFDSFIILQFFYSQSGPICVRLVLCWVTCPVFKRGFVFLLWMFSLWSLRKSLRVGLCSLWQLLGKLVAGEGTIIVFSAVAFIRWGLRLLGIWSCYCAHYYLFAHATVSDLHYITVPSPVARRTYRKISLLTVACRLTVH